ncbi:MAG: hypothetical protein JO040_08450 [Gemmatimonadetes bacterium]|nr:hypothetical protein [Gemmatimonadota bacterium]
MRPGLLIGILLLAGACRAAPEAGSTPAPGRAEGGVRPVAPAPATGRPGAILPLGDSAAHPRWQSALVVFADGPQPADLQWLRAEGFEVESTTPATHAVVVRVPPTYSKDPMAVNRRIVRFDVQMR